MWTNSIKSILSKIRWQNSYVRWSVLALLVVILIWFVTWVFAPIKQTTASQQNVQNVVKTFEVLPEEINQPNYFWGHSLFGIEKEVKCKIVNGLIKCPQPTDFASKLDQLRTKQAENVMRYADPTPISFSVDQQIKLEQALGTPYVIESDGTMTIFDGAFPKRSDFIKLKAEWQEKCIDSRGRVKRNRSCRSRSRS